MSWISITIVLVFASLLCAFVLCEWLVKRRLDTRRDDRDSLT